jgi:hypothetical protein
MTAQAQDELRESLTKLLERITQSAPKRKSKAAKELT